jgi:hypothetical protein
MEIPKLFHVLVVCGASIGATTGVGCAAANPDQPTATTDNGGNGGNGSTLTRNYPDGGKADGGDTGDTSGRGSGSPGW